MKYWQTWLLVALAILLASTRHSPARRAPPPSPPPDSHPLDPAQTLPSAPRHVFHPLGSAIRVPERPVAPVAAQRGAPNLPGVMPLRPPESALLE